MICECHSGHVILNRRTDQVIDAAGSIQKAVMGMIVEMDKLRHRTKPSDSGHYGKQAVMGLA